MDIVVSLEDVSFDYGGRRVLDGLTVVLPAGSFHFLIGPSGAGKTTFLRILSLEHRPQAGRFTLFGEETGTLDRPKITLLRRRIGVVFQDFRLLDHLTVSENVALPLRVAGRKVAEHRKDLVDLLDWVGLSDRSDAHPPELSAGEKQRTAIARAVINSPDLILADEPTGNVDPDIGDRLMRMLIELNRLGKTVLVATHDLALVRSAKRHVGARVLRLAEGQLAQGASEL